MKKYLFLAGIFAAFFGCKEPQPKTGTPLAPAPEMPESAPSVPRQEPPAERPLNGESADEGSSLTGNVSNLNINISLEADELFDFDKAVLKPEAEPSLQAVFDKIDGKTESKLQIIGYTDAKGSASYNKTLSVKRAEAVKTWLQAKGLKNPIVTEGKGAENPVAPNTKPDGSDNPEGRAQNRRVEIKTVTQQSL